MYYHIKYLLLFLGRSIKTPLCCYAYEPQLSSQIEMNILFLAGMRLAALSRPRRPDLDEGTHTSSIKVSRTSFLSYAAT